jgi:hypothetical protein
VSSASGWRGAFGGARLQRPSPAATRGKSCARDGDAWRRTMVCLGLGRRVEWGVGLPRCGSYGALEKGAGPRGAA